MCIVYPIYYGNDKTKSVRKKSAEEIIWAYAGKTSNYAPIIPQTK